MTTSATAMQLPRLLLTLQQGWLQQLLQHLTPQMLPANAFTLPGVHDLTFQEDSVSLFYISPAQIAFLHITIAHWTNVPSLSFSPRELYSPLQQLPAHCGSMLSLRHSICVSHMYVSVNITRGLCTRAASLCAKPRLIQQIMSSRAGRGVLGMSFLTTVVLSNRAPALSTAAAAPNAAASTYAQATDTSRTGQSKLRFYLAGKLVPPSFTIFQARTCLPVSLLSTSYSFRWKEYVYAGPALPFPTLCSLALPSRSLLPCLSPICPWLPSHLLCHAALLLHGP